MCSLMLGEFVSHVMPQDYILKKTIPSWAALPTYSCEKYSKSYIFKSEYAATIKIFDSIWFFECRDEIIYCINYAHYCVSMTV